jgi:hypothetical protein
MDFVTCLKDLDVSDVHVATTGPDKKKKPSKTPEGRTSKAGFSIPLAIAKVDEDQHLIFGWASVVEKDGELVVDKQNDIILPADLETAVYDYVLECSVGKSLGNMHGSVGHGRLVESMVFTREKQAALGIDLGRVGWWVGYKVDDPQLWASLKRGERPEFSIGGYGMRESVASHLEKYNENHDERGEFSSGGGGGGTHDVHLGFVAAGVDLNMSDASVKAAQALQTKLGGTTSGSTDKGVIVSFKTPGAAAQFERETNRMGFNSSRL